MSEPAWFLWATPRPRNSAACHISCAVTRRAAEGVAQHRVCMTIARARGTPDAPNRTADSYPIFRAFIA